MTLAISVLKSGGVVLFPTETAYGLAADATNPRAVRRVFEIKGREPGKTPPLICADRKTAEEYVVLDPLLVPLVDEHWPGALTVVGKVGKGLASGAVKEDGTVAVRVSPHPIAKALAKGIAGPIVATSANVSGLATCYSVSAFLKQLKAAGHPQPDFAIDEGPIPRRKPSTIVSVKKGKVVVLREGSVVI
ncbi:MAG: L-threonylcarbamoyladenylate synthase [Candidatus Uhrbacteria bacterium]